MRIGILTQAQEAKTRTDKASIIEQVQVDILGKQAENNSEDVFASDLEEILKKYFSNEEENIKNIVEGTTKEGEETKLISKEDSNIKIDLSEIYSGEIKKVVLAKDVLIPNENGATAEEKSPYILYNNLLCRVLYNDQEHGLQIITNDNIRNEYGEEEKIMLGAEDPTIVNVSNEGKKALQSYNCAVDTLNNKAKAYMGTKVIDARSIGSVAILGKDGKFQGDISKNAEYTNLENYEVKEEDTNYIEDQNQIKILKLNATDYTWLASRCVIFSQETDLYVRYLDVHNNVRDYPDSLYSRGAHQNYGYRSIEYGFRPVFLLPSDILISSGEGSLDKPYVIE